MSQTNPSTAAPVVESAGAAADRPVEPSARPEDGPGAKARPEGEHGPGERTEDKSEPEARTEGESEPAARAEDEVVEADLLVEDISIDGMCGVY